MSQDTVARALKAVGKPASVSEIGRAMKGLGPRVPGIDPGRIREDLRALQARGEARPVAGPQLGGTRPTLWESVE